MNLHSMPNNWLIICSFTNGKYYVALPDGRLQTVTYHVDDAYGGYIADVKYTGTAHPHPHPKAHPQPAYHGPAPHHI